MNSLNIFFAFTLLFSCNPQNMNTTYTYTDQNNNTYYISETSASYFPITKDNSSSGIYDGGKKIEVDITHNQFIKINQIANQLLEDTTLHTDKREMLTSILSSKNMRFSKKTVLIPSEKRRIFESLLLQLFDK